MIPSVQHPQKGGTVGTEETAASQMWGEIKGFNGLREDEETVLHLNRGTGFRTLCVCQKLENYIH